MTDRMSVIWPHVEHAPLLICAIFQPHPGYSAERLPRHQLMQWESPSQHTCTRFQIAVYTCEIKPASITPCMWIALSMPAVMQMLGGAALPVNCAKRTAAQNLWLDPKKILVKGRCNFVSIQFCMGLGYELCKVLLDLHGATFHHWTQRASH